MKRDRIIPDFKKFYEKKLEIRDLEKGDRMDIFVRNLLNGRLVLNDDNDTAVDINQVKINGIWSPIADLNFDTLKNFIRQLNGSGRFFKEGTRLYKTIFRNDNNEYKLTDFKKTRDYGQRGPGVDVSIKEEILAVYFDMYQIFGYTDITQVSFDRYTALNRINNNIHINNQITWDKINKFIHLGWGDSFLHLPEKFWEKFHLEKTNRTIYDIYHLNYKGDSVVKILKNKYYELLKDITGDRSVDFSKFCPADVYLVDREKTNVISAIIDESANLFQLSSNVQTLFNRKIFVPISLKRIQMKRNNNFIINNLDSKIMFNRIFFHIFENPTTGISSKITATSHWTNDIGYVEHRLLEMTLDSSNTSKTVNIDGEVKVSDAPSRTGKISLNNINDIILSKNIILNGVRPYGYYTNMDTTDLVRIANDHQQNLLRSCDIVRASLYNSRDITNEKNSLVSKIQSLEVLIALNTIKRSDIDIFNDIISQLFKHAMSIETIYFLSPKYYRQV